MNKTEFMNSLNEALLRLSKADRDDILIDYEEHFRAGAEQGISEEQVAEKLGDPADIAAQYLENLPEDAKNAPAVMAVYDEPQQAEPEKSETPAADAEPAPARTNGGRVVGNVFFWIGAVVTIIALIYAWIGILFATIGVFAGAAALVVASIPCFPYSILVGLGFVFLAGGLVLLGVIGIFGLRYSMFGLKQLIKAFKRISNKIMGRSAA